MHIMRVRRNATIVLATVLFSVLCSCVSSSTWTRRGIGRVTHAVLLDGHALFASVKGVIARIDIRDGTLST